MKTIYLGLGSNLGNRETNLQIALQLLPPEIQVNRRSSVIETEPMYVKEQPRFLNMIVEAQTELLPKDVLQKIKSIEQTMGEHEHNQPRVIDIDLLFYGDEVIKTPELIVPHPGMAERQFVLGPIAEIAPDFMHPILHVTIAELLHRL